MTNEPTVFEKTYKDYLAQIARIDLSSIEQKLKVQVEGKRVKIPLFGRLYEVSETGITDSSGKQPSLDICVILSKYLLLCPDIHPAEKEWVSYKDLKDSGPLTAYFANDVERAITSGFAGRLDDLKEVTKNLGGYPPDIEAEYDLSARFSALPRVPVILLFSDKDEEFPAKSLLLFERRAESYLDAECLAMVGRLLFTVLKKAVNA